MEQLPDPKLVELAQAGDQQAFAELYNRYFDPVYDFVARMTRNRDEAADIAQDTFLKAINAFGGLQGGASFRGWIFTIARNTALNRLEKASRTRPLAFEDAEGEEASVDVIDMDRFSDSEEADAVAALVWEAAAGLDPKQLSLLDLHLRQGLESGEIADVLGVTKDNGYVILNRLKKAVEDSIGAFVMWKDGRQYCADLNAALSQADIRAMSPDVRKVVERHVAQCQACETRKKKLAPLAAIAGFGAIGAPMGAKAHILDGLMQQWPGPPASRPGNAAYRANDRLRSSGPGDGGGSGGVVTPAAEGGMFFGRGSFIKVGAGLGLLAVAFFGLLFFPSSPIALTRGDSGKTRAGNGGDPTQAGTGAPTATPTSATGASFIGPSPSPTASLSPSSSSSPAGAGPTNTATKTNTPAPTPGPGTPTFTPTSTSTNTPTSTSTPTPGSTPTATATPCVATIARFGSGPLTIAPGGGSNFTVSNTQGCSATYSVSSDAATAWLVVTGGGTLAAFEQATVAVSVNAALVPAAENIYTGTITVTGPNNSFVVQVRTTVGGDGPGVMLTTASCAGSPVDFLAHATDDIGVTAVTLSYALSTGTSASRVMALNPGDSPANGTWHVTFNLPPSTTIVTFTITATDGAFRTDSVSGKC
jgi:RNA polymerase sigma factor (sigma-70 family)